LRQLVSVPTHPGIKKTLRNTGGFFVAGVPA